MEAGMRLLARQLELWIGGDPERRRMLDASEEAARQRAADAARRLRDRLVASGRLVPSLDGPDEPPQPEPVQPTPPREPPLPAELTGAQLDRVKRKLAPRRRKRKKARGTPCRPRQSAPSKPSGKLLDTSAPEQPEQLALAFDACI
jgi:hypothetical protein